MTSLPCTASCDSTQVVTFLTNNTMYSPPTVNDGTWANRSPNSGNLPEGYIGWQIMGSSQASGAQGWSYFFSNKGGAGPTNCSFPYIAGQQAGYAGSGNSGGPGPGGAGGWQTWLSNNGAASDVGPGYGAFLSSIASAQTAGKKVFVSLGGFNMTLNILQDGDQTVGPSGNTQTATELAAALAYNLCNINSTQKAAAAALLTTSGTDLQGNFVSTQCPFRTPSGTPILFDGIDIDIEHPTPMGLADLVTFAQTLKSLGVLVSIPAQAPQLNNAVGGTFTNLGYFGPPMSIKAQPTPTQVAADAVPISSPGPGLLQQTGIKQGGLVNVDQVQVQFYNQGYSWFLDWDNSTSLPSESQNSFVSQIAQWAYFFQQANVTTKLFVGISNAGDASAMIRGNNFYNSLNARQNFPNATTAGNAAYVGIQIKQAILDTMVALNLTSLEWFGGIMVQCLPDASTTPQPNFARTVTSITGGTLVAQDGANAGDAAVSFGPSGTYQNEMSALVPQTITINISGDVGSVLIGSTLTSSAPWPTSVLEGQNILITGTSGDALTSLVVNPDPQSRDSYSINQSSDTTAALMSFAQMPTPWSSTVTIAVSTTAVQDIQTSLANTGNGSNNRQFRFEGFGVKPVTIGRTVGIIVGIAVPLIILLVWLSIMKVIPK